MGRHKRIQRMEGDLGLRKKINRLNRTADRISKNTVPGLLGQDCAVTRTRVTLHKPFVREEKERCVLPAPIRWTAFAKSGGVHWSANIKTIVVLPQDWLCCSIEIIEPCICVGPAIDYLEEGSAVEIVGSTLGYEINLCGSTPGIRAHRARGDAEFSRGVQRR